MAQKTKPKAAPREDERRVVCMSAPIAKALEKHARWQGLSVSPLIRRYIIDGLRRDGVKVSP